MPIYIINFQRKGSFDRRRVIEINAPNAKKAQDILEDQFKNVVITSIYRLI
jgi:hypothetical protein